MMRFGAIQVSVVASLLALLSFYSCSGGDSGKQANPKLNQEQMVAILIDFHLAEAAIRIKPANPGQNQAYTNHYYDALFKKHKVSKEEFESSMLYYKNDLKTLNELYMQVVDSLNKMQGPAPSK